MSQVRINREEGFVEIYDIAPNPHFMYDIAFDRIRTEEQLENWIDHLSRKNWFNPLIERDLRDVHTAIWHLHKQRTGTSK